MEQCSKMLYSGSRLMWTPLRGHLISSNLFFEHNAFYTGVTPLFLPHLNTNCIFFWCQIILEFVALTTKVCISVSAHQMRILYQMGILYQTGISELEHRSFSSCTHHHSHWKTKHLTQQSSPCYDRPLSMQHLPTLLAVVATRKNSDVYQQQKCSQIVCSCLSFCHITFPKKSAVVTWLQKPQPTWN